MPRWGLHFMSYLLIKEINMTNNTLTLRSFDIPQLHKFGLGFDNMFDEIMRVTSQQTNSNYPPHNVIKTGEDTVTIEVAVAGFAEGEIDIALDKAYTASSFGLPTSQWTEVLKHHSPAVAQGLVARPRFVAFGGGLPIVHQGERIGGIGVSGGSEQQDEEIAQAGLAVLNLKN